MISMDHRNVGDYSNGPVQHRWNPYAMNGGTILAIAGEDFAIVAGDTRLSEGFSIMSRNCEKTYNLTEKTVLGCAGFHGDVLTLTKNIQARLKMYEQEHGTKMNSNAIAAMLATILYSRRFFPFYVSNIVAGLDEQGKGCIYSYDPVGSYEREVYKAAGSASSMLQPLLDSQIGGKNNSGGHPGLLSREKAAALIKDVFISAAERDIYTGDAVNMKIIDKNGITVDTFKLRRD